MQIYYIIICVITILLSIYFIPDYAYYRYENMIRLIQGACVLTLIGSILVFLLSII